MHAPNPALLARLQRLVLGAEFINYSFNFIFALLATFLIGRGEWTAADVGLALAGANFIAAVALPWVGRAIDRNAYLWPLTVALLGNVTGTLGLVLPTSRALTFASATLVILSVGIISTMTTHVLEGLTPNERRRQLATVNYVVMNLGYAVSGGFAYSLLNDHRAVLVTCDVLTHVLICGVLYDVSRRLAGDPAKPTAPATAAPWREILTPHLGVAFACVLVLMVTMFSHFSVLQVLYKDLGLDLAPYAAACFAVSSLVVIAIGPWVQRLGLPLWVRTVGGAALIAAGYSLQPLIQSMTMNVVLTICWAVGEVLIAAEFSQAFFLNSPVEHAGAISGLRSATSKFAQVLCPLISAVFRPTTLVAFTWLFGVPTLVAGFGLYVLIKRAEQTSAS